MSRTSPALLLLCLFFIGSLGLLDGQVMLQPVKSNDTVHPQYRLLEERARQYEALAEGGGWDKLPVKKDSIRQISKRTFAGLLRKRLEAEGYRASRLFGNKDSIDPVLKKAIVDFQRDHGIDTTGFPGPVTLSAMNVSAKDRAREIRLNQKRWLALRNMPSEYVLVNIPDFRMMYISTNKIQLQMRVVVGKKDRQTPVFNARMTYVVLNPTWNIPTNILRKDVISKIKKDPAYITNSHMSLFMHDSAGRHREADPAQVDWSKIDENNFPFEIVQKAGEDNALGKIKFMFPNDFSVYMHDSPHRELFLANEPVFSSGCVRLSEALRMGLFILEKEGWDQEKFDKTLAEGKTLTVPLKNQPMVYIQYMTCWVDDNGRLQFRKDIYNKNR